MATIARSERYPNVLLVTGEDVVSGNYRANLISILEASDSPGPVRRGTHDVWATYQVDSSENPNHAWMDADARPRKRRGVLELAAPPSASDVATLSPRLGTLIHELGHCWLVPRELTIRSNDYWPAPGRTAPGMDAYDSSIAFTEGSRFWGPSLHARQGCHWSVWVNSGGSCMDGVPWSRQGDADGLARWAPGTLAPITLSPSGLPNMTLPARFGDADLWLMGVISREEAFTSDGNRLYWMEPRLMAPLEYHAGLVILFGFNDAFYFGYRTDHRVLAVQRTDGPTLLVNAPEHRPFPDASRAIALRVIRRGTTYVFQARYSQLTSDLLPRHLRGATSWPAPSAGPVGTDWITVAQLQATERPQAVGLGVKTWRPILCEAHFQHLEIASGGLERAMTTSADLPIWRPSPTSGLSSLPERLVAYLPAAGARVRRRGNVATVSTPWFDFDAEGRYVGYDAFNDSSSLDRAPKLLAAAPASDFVIATTARMDRSGLSPWAGGAALEKTMWGVERWASMADVVVPDEHRFWQDVPADNTYKTAFIIAARAASDIRSEHEQAVDALRRYYDAAVPLIMRNRRRSDSTL